MVTPPTSTLHPQLTAYALNLIDVGIFAVDREMKLVLWNDFMAHHTGRSAAQVLGTPLLAQFPELPQTWLTKKLERVFLLKNSSFSTWDLRPYLFAFLHNRPVTGGVDYMQQNTSFYPIKGADGAVEFVCICVFDVTDAAMLHRQLQETYAQLEAEHAEQRRLIAELAEAHGQLVQSEKMVAIGQLAAGVAHEINNPVGFVTSNFGSLERYLHGTLDLISLYDEALPQIPEAQRNKIAAAKQALDFDYIHDDASDLINESKDGLERVKRIVSDLRDFSRVGETDWQMASVHKCIESTLSVANNELKYKANIIKNFGDLPEIECMPFQLNQVFLNLFVNAAQAIPSHGTITITTGTEADGVFIEVGDTGCGMAPETASRVFDPFFTTKPIGKGTGLGLSVTRNIVLRHQGTIDVCSQLGEGTRFKVWLPIVHKSDESAPESVG